MTIYQNKDKNNNNKYDKNNFPTRKNGFTKAPIPDDKHKNPQKATKGKPPPPGDDYRPDSYLANHQFDKRQRQPDILEINHDDDDMYDGVRNDPNGYRARFHRKKNYMNARGTPR